MIIKPWVHWVVAPAVMLIAALVTWRLGRVYAQLRPLTLPFLLALAAAFALTISNWGMTGWPLLALTAPLLVLSVRVIVLMFRGLFRHSQGQAPPRLMENVLGVALYGFGIIVSARICFALELTPFLATSAVVGAVVGLALQDTLGNLFAGIALHTEAPFQVGDWIKLGEREGCVEQVSWRAMRLRTWYGDTLTIPNNDVARQAVLNYSQPARAHFRTIHVGVGLETPPGRAIELLAQVARDTPGVVSDPPPEARILSYAESAIQYEIRYATPRYEDYRRLEGEIQRLLWYRLRREGVSIPFPVRTVNLQRPSTRDEQDASLAKLESLLHSVDIFRPLVDVELHFAATRFRHVWYAAGEMIIEEDAHGDSFFVIARGQVEVSRQQAGSRRSLARLGEGQFFGEAALLTGQRRSATVVALTDVELFTIDKNGFHDILVHKPQIAEDISTVLSTRSAAHTQIEEETEGTDPPSKDDIKVRILGRIRRYFGL